MYLCMLSVCVCVYVCVCMHVCTCMCGEHVHVYLCWCVCMCMYAHVYVCWCCVREVLRENCNILMLKSLASQETAHAIISSRSFKSISKTLWPWSRVRPLSCCFQHEEFRESLLTCHRPRLYSLPSVRTLWVRIQPNLTSINPVMS